MAPQVRADLVAPLVHGTIRDKWRPDRRYQESGQEWREWAECLGQDPRLFDLQDETETGLVGRGVNRKYNEEKFEAAWNFCSRCPVKTACRLDAISTGDHEVTVRGGMNPYDVVPSDGAPKRGAVMSEATRLARAWEKYLAGEVMHRVRRAGKGPTTGPWPEWDDYLQARLAELTQVMHKPSWEDEARPGWLMAKPGKHDTKVRVIMDRGDAYERRSVHRGDVWLRD